MGRKINQLLFYVTLEPHFLVHRGPERVFLPVHRSKKTVSCIIVSELGQVGPKKMMVTKIFYNFSLLKNCFL